MKTKKLEEKDNVLTFALQDSSVAEANKLRKALLGEIPTMAIDEVEFFENAAPMFDEYVAHRLALVPLTTPKGYKLPEDCCGGNCSSCSTHLTLDVTGPATVYSRDLIPADAEVKPAYDNIPIMKLGENQKLRLDAKAVLGLGKNHAKWSPCAVHYKYAEKKGVEDKTSFVFELESFGQMSPDEMLKKVAGKKK